MKGLSHRSYPFIRPFTGIMTSIYKDPRGGPLCPLNPHFPGIFFNHPGPHQTTRLNGFFGSRCKESRENLCSVGAGFTLSSPASRFPKPITVLELSVAGALTDWCGFPRPEGEDGLFTRKSPKNCVEIIWKVQFRNQINQILGHSKNCGKKWFGEISVSEKNSLASA